VGGWPILLQDYTWFGDIQLAKENLRHVLIVVLAGMDQQLRHKEMRLQCRDNRRDFHEVGTRADHVKDFHRGVVFNSQPTLQCGATVQSVS